MAEKAKNPAKGAVIAILLIAGTILGSIFFGGGSPLASNQVSENQLASMTASERRSYYAAQNDQISGISTGLESNSLGAGGCDTSLLDCYVASYSDLYDSVQSALPFAQADRDAAIANFFSLFSENFSTQETANIENQLKLPRSSAFESNIISFFAGMSMTLTTPQISQAQLANEMAHNVRIRMRFVDAYESRYAGYCEKDSGDDIYTAGEVTMIATNITHQDTCTQTTNLERLCVNGEYKSTEVQYNFVSECEHGCFEGACRSHPAFGGLELTIPESIRPGETVGLTLTAKDANGEVDLNYDAAANHAFILDGPSGGQFTPSVLTDQYRIISGVLDITEVAFADNIPAGEYTLSVVNQSDNSITATANISIVDTSPDSILLDTTIKTTGSGADTTAQVGIHVRMVDETDELVDSYTSDKIRFTLTGADLKTEYQGHLSMTAGVFDAGDFLDALSIGTYTLIVSDDSQSPTMTSQSVIEVTEEQWRPACATETINVECMAKGGKKCTTNACPEGCKPRQNNTVNNSCFRRADTNYKFTPSGWKLTGYNNCDTNANQKARDRVLRVRCVEK